MGLIRKLSASIGVLLEACFPVKLNLSRCIVSLVFCKVD
jgi:hypothetical protein